MIKEHEEVTLTDGRVVKVEELTGLDEMIAKKLLGGSIKQQGDLIQLREVLLAFAIKEIDGKKVDRPRNIVDVQTLMSQLKSKDTARLDKAYNRLNSDVEEAAGESQAVDSASTD